MIRSLRHPYAFGLASAAISCALAFAPAAAQQKEEEPDTLVISDTLTYDDINRETVFTGNVVLTRGNMTLHSDRLTMREDDAGFQHGTATVEGGKRVLLRQETPENFEVMEARGEKAVYNGKSEEIEMIGKAVITRFICGKPFDNIQGERVIYRQATSTYQAFGGANSAAPGGRVRSLATPRARADAAIEACRKQGGAG